MRYFVIALLLVGCSKEEELPDKLTLKRLNIVDSKGRVRVRVGRVRGKFGLYVYSKGGKLIGAFKDNGGEGGAFFTDREGHLRLAMSAKPFIGLYDPPKNGDVGVGRVTFVARKFGWAGMQLFDPKGNDRTALFYAPDGDAAGFVQRKNKTPHISIMSIKGQPFFMMMKNGKIKFSLPLKGHYNFR